MRAFEGPVPEFELTAEGTARAERCAELVREQWAEVVRKQPWVEPIKVFGARRALAGRRAAGTCCSCRASSGRRGRAGLPLW